MDIFRNEFFQTPAKSVESRVKIHSRPQIMTYLKGCL
jgi:hypothetical protein